MELDAEFIGKLATLGEKFLGDLGNGRPLNLAIYKNVVHGSIRLSFRPTIP